MTTEEKETICDCQIVHEHFLTCGKHTMVAVTVEQYQTLLWGYRSYMSLELGRLAEAQK